MTAQATTRKDLIEAVVAQFEGTGLTKKVIREIATAAFDELAEAVQTEPKVRVVNLGTFRRVTLAARNYRNLQTGETIAVGPRVAVRFRLAK